MIVIPARMGRLNKRTLLNRLLRMGVASRADLAKSLGLSQPTTGKIVDQLLQLGVVEEIDGDDSRIPNGQLSSQRTRGKLGRPGRMLRLNRTQPRFVGIQLGVKETSLSILPTGTSADDSWMVRLKTPGSADDWAMQLQKAALCFQQKDFWGVLLSVPGIVDEKRGRVIFSPNMHWTETADLPELIQNAWRVPVVLVQEERALALGHQAVDASGEDFLLVDFGEGVGGAMIVANKLFVTPLPISGELGHTPVPGNQRTCGCGAVGCLETVVSTRGLLESFAQASPGITPSWDALAAHVAERGVESWLAEALDAAAGVIAGDLNVLGLRRVIITGSINELPPAVFSHLSNAISEGALWGRFGKVDVEAAPRRRIAGLLAVAIDRLVVPLAEDTDKQETPRPVSAVGALA